MRWDGLFVECLASYLLSPDVKQCVFFNKLPSGFEDLPLIDGWWECVLHWWEDSGPPMLHSYTSLVFFSVLFSFPFIYNSTLIVISSMEFVGFG